MSISPQTVLSTSTRRLTAHIVHALIIHPREIQTMSSLNHDTGSYETLYEADISSGDVVMYWTMTDTHVVPNRQQYDEHTHQADMIPGVSISYQTALQKTSFLRFLAHPASTLTIHLGERYKLYDL